MAEKEIWATIDLMGHVQIAGRVSRPADWGGLIQVDIPIDENDGFRTQLIGMPAIYKIDFVSEEIARAYAAPERGIVIYDAPIVTREQHYSAMQEVERRNLELERKIEELRRRLTAINSLPEKCIVEDAEQS
jgi:hypothetical protein